MLTCRAVLALGLLACGFANPLPHSAPQYGTSQKDFAELIKTFGLNIPQAEYTHRYGIYQQNVNLINKHNQLYLKGKVS
jgi:hypothetical protein